jgi:hypothetical protein
MIAVRRAKPEQRRIAEFERNLTEFSKEYIFIPEKITY